MLNVDLTRTILTFAQLGLICGGIFLLEHTHLLYLVKVDHKALFHVVKVLDALSAEDGWVLAAVEMLDALVMYLAEVGSDFDLEFRVFFVSI